MSPAIEYGLTDIDFYTWGLCYATVCVPNDMPLEDVERLTNAKNPTGIESPWCVSPDTHFRPDKNGKVKTNPCLCDRSPETHQHHLLIC